MEFKDLIKTRRKELNLTLEDIGKVVGVSKATVLRWESGEIENVRRDKIALLAKALHCTPAYLMGWEEEVSIAESHTFPIIGEVAAGFGSLAYEETGDTVAIPDEWLHGQDPSSFFILVARGDSMKPFIEDGDLLLCHRQSSVDPNTIAIVLYESELATVKKVNYDPSERWWMDLIPLNRDYEIMHVVNEDLNRCKVLGSVWKMIREIEK